MKEVLTLQIGQCGTQIGNALWELFCAEHNFSPDGNVEDPNLVEIDDKSHQVLFNESQKYSHVPRLVTIDLEPNVIDEVRTGSFRNLFHPDQLISGKEDAANNFANGFFTLGRTLYNEVIDQIREQIEKCDHLDSIFLYRSNCGGTGSGFTCSLFEALDDYAKVARFDLPIQPSSIFASSVVEPYNSLLAQHFSMPDIDVSFMASNEALYNLLAKYMSIKQPTFNEVNRFIASVMSNVMASHRFTTPLDGGDLTCMQTNLVPYPRIHFPLLNMAPVSTKNKGQLEIHGVQEMTRSIFNPSNQMLNCSPTQWHYVSSVLIFRGVLSPTEVHSSINHIKDKKVIHFVDWCPTSFKVSLIQRQPVYVHASPIIRNPSSVTMISNSTAIIPHFQSIGIQFQLLFSKRCFVHWFVGAGLEENEFVEALLNVRALINDYKAICPNEELAVEKEVDATIDPNDTIINNQCFVTDYAESDDWTDETFPGNYVGATCNASLVSCQKPKSGVSSFSVNINE